MNHDITLEQIKERLVPILQKMYPNQPLSKGEDRKHWEEVYSPLYSLFLDISVTSDKQAAKPARDTQFSGYAKLLMEEIKDKVYIDSGEEDIYEATQCIARLAYDFAKHTMSHVSQGMAAENEGGPKYLEENMRCIPDMTEWPEETKA